MTTLEDKQATKMIVVVVILLGGGLFGVGELVRCLASNLSFPETAAKPEVTDTALKCQRERRLPH